MSMQPELDLEHATYDHFTITLAKGAVGDMEVIRTHAAGDVDGAINLIESLRDATAGRDNVTWQNEGVDAAGVMFGLAPAGVVFEISVVPPLATPLS
jgi:hypothetical protein